MSLHWFVLCLFVPLEEDLLVNVKDLGPDVKENDVVEIYHPEDDLPRLLLQIPSTKDDVTVQKGLKLLPDSYQIICIEYKQLCHCMFSNLLLLHCVYLWTLLLRPHLLSADTISIEQSIASTFQLRIYKDVIVNKVDPKAVALELVELTFKDQYLGRSEMWRIKKNLVSILDTLLSYVLWTWQEDTWLIIKNTIWLGPENLLIIVTDYSSILCMWKHMILCTVSSDFRLPRVAFIF